MIIRHEPKSLSQASTCSENQMGSMGAIEGIGAMLLLCTIDDITKKVQTYCETYSEKKALEQAKNLKNY